MHRMRPLVLALLLGDALVFCACHQVSAPMPGMPTIGGTGNIGVHGPPLVLPPPPSGRRLVNTRWLFGDEFFPPGAKRILPSPAINPVLRETPQTKYPSMESLVSPDGALTLFSDSGAAKNVMVHWLMAYRKGDPRPASLFHTHNSYEVLWSADSAHVAITEFIGDNRSEVMVGDMSDCTLLGPLKVDEVVTPYFTSPQLGAPRFLRARAFGDGSLLLVRGVGRTEDAPFDQFGYEVLVDVNHPGDADAMRFVRGYVLPGHEADN